MADLLFDKINERLQAFRNHKMIIIAPGISRDLPFDSINIFFNGSRFQVRIRKRQHKDGFAFRQNQSWVRASSAGTVTC